MFGIRTTRWMLFALSLHAAAGSAAPAVRSISLERDCNGCASGSRLVLHADGRAELATLGKARLGTSDQLRRGRLSMETFAALAQLAQARGFFAMDDEIADPALQDGAWLMLRIERSDGGFKQVFRRGHGGPAALAELIEAVDAAGHCVTFDTPLN